MPAKAVPAPLPFDIDHDLEQAKAFVRLRQAAVPVPEAFFTLRAGALILQLIGGAILALALGAALVFALTDVVEEALDIPGYYVSIVAIVVGGGLGLFVLITGELLTLQVVIARNTRLTTVILSEMNFAEASAREDLARRLVQRVDSPPEPAPASGSATTAATGPVAPASHPATVFPADVAPATEAVPSPEAPRTWSRPVEEPREAGSGDNGSSEA